MLLIRKKLFTQCKQTNNFLSQLFSFFETLWIQENFSNELVIWDWHSNWSKKLFQIVRKSGSTTISFTSWVQSDEDTAVRINFHFLSNQLKVRLIGLDGKLYNLNLLRNSRELFLEQSIELIKAPPGATPHKSKEDPSHTLIVKSFITIENKTDPAKKHSHSFNSLCFACTRRPIRIAPHAQTQSQTQSDVTFVCQRSVH